MQNLDQLVDKITSHHLFVRLKDVVENYPGWHDHEPVYDHSVKTANIAKDQVSGDFIKDPKAKKLFLAWIGEDVFGTQRKDTAVLIALLHDSGKILKYREDGAEKTLITAFPHEEDRTLCPGHEHWGGSLVVPAILEEYQLPQKLVEHIASVVKLHDAFYGNYFPTKETWSTEEIIMDMKSRAQGYYKEVLLNIYCDAYTATPFDVYKKRIEEIFNEPVFYSPRTYFIP